MKIIPASASTWLRFFGRASLVSFLLIGLSFSLLKAQNNLPALQDQSSEIIQTNPALGNGGAASLQFSGFEGSVHGQGGLGTFFAANCNFSFNLNASDASCPAGMDGSIQTTISSGTGPFTFQWTGPNGFTSSNQSIANLAPGSYMVAITDGSSCTDSAMATVGANPDTIAPVLVGVPSDDTLGCGDALPPDLVTATDNCGILQVFRSNSVSSFDCSPGLAAWWPAEGNANDAQGSLNASLINGTTFASGIAGDAFALDGLNDYIEVNDTIRFAANNYSVAVWFNTSDTTRNQNIFSASDTLNGQPGVQVSLDSNGVVTFLHRFPFGSAGGTTITSAPGLNDGNWHQLVALKRDTVMRLFIDNTSQGSAVDLTNIDEPLKITVGRLSFLTFSDNQYFNGLIDENRVYSKALCSEEIKGLYLAGIQNNTWAPTFKVTRTWTALDVNGNFSAASQELVFIDQTPPTLVVPQPITIQCTGNGGVPRSNGQVRNWLNSAHADDECSCVVLTFAIPSFLPADCANGFTTLVTFSATDECGNLTVGSSTITVIDTLGPNLTCPNVTVTAPDSSCEAVVNYNVSAVDGCTGASAAVTYSIQPGSVFNVGSTLVTASATDTCGYSSNCSFSVVVNPQPLNVQINSPTFNCGANISCNGANDGAAAVNVTGGCAPYSYDWNVAGAGASRTGLSAGTVSVTVTDANGTMANRSLTLVEPAAVTINSSVQPFDCGNGNGGSIDLSINGGATCLPYGFSWTGPGGFSASSEDLSGLNPGAYTVVVTDASNCSDTASVTISTVDSLAASIACCQDTLIQNGDTVGILVDLDGAGPWTLQYTDGATVQTLSVGASPYVLNVSPASSTTYSLTSIGNGNACPGSVCGSATVAVSNECVLETVTCPFIIDFNEDGNGNPLPAGTELANQWSNLGFAISAVNNRSNHPDKAIIFDSSNPTGNDPDLGTPNAAFGGPGIGSGGGIGQPGQNDQAYGNLVIIPEDDLDANNDGLVDDPDDEAQGGTITIDFAAPVDLDYVTLVDLDDGTGGSVISFLLPSGTVSMPIPDLGNNSVKEMAVNQSDVIQVQIHFAGSGGLAEFSYCPGNLGNVVQSCLSASIGSVADNQTCRTVELNIDCNGPCADSVDFIDVAIGCGMLDTAFTSTNLQIVSITDDPVSGITGIRIQNPVTCADTGRNFTLTYTMCADGACWGSYCAPIVAFGGGGCVEYTRPGSGAVAKLASGATPADGQAVSEIGKARATAKVLPNPTSGPVTVLIEGLAGQDVQVLVSGIDGKVVSQQRLSLRSGMLALPVDLSNSPQGIYVVDIRMGSERSVHKLVRQ